MRAIRNLLILILIAVLGVSAYFGINLYMENKAAKQINDIIKEEHLEGLVDYGSVKYSLLSNTVTINNVKLYLPNSRTQEDAGLLKFNSIQLKGNWETKYTLLANNITLINLNQDLPKNLINKKIAAADNAVFKVKKSGSIITSFIGNINNIQLDKNLFKLKNSPNAKDFAKIFYINNPINISMNMEANPNKKTMSIKKYEINFQNNFAISYSLYADNIDFLGINKTLKLLKQKPKNFIVITNIMGKLMQIKVKKVKFVLINHGFIDRLLNYEAKRQHTTKQKLIKKELTGILASPFSTTAYKPLQNFLNSKANRFIVEIENSQNLTIGDLMMMGKDVNNILQKVDFNFKN